MRLQQQQQQQQIINCSDSFGHLIVINTIHLFRLFADLLFVRWKMHVRKGRKWPKNCDRISNCWLKFSFGCRDYLRQSHTHSHTPHTLINQITHLYRLQQQNNVWQEKEAWEKRMLTTADSEEKQEQKWEAHDTRERKIKKKMLNRFDRREN